MNKARVVALKQALLVNTVFLKGNCSSELYFEKKIGCFDGFHDQSITEDTTISCCHNFNILIFSKVSDLFLTV